MFSRLCLAAALPLAAFASGHGPVFALATPTNPRNGWSFDVSTMARYGQGDWGSMARFALGYGITEDLKIQVSAPVVFQAERLIPARVAPFTPMGGDFEGLALWRFHRQNIGVGSRFESTLIGGILAPGPQDAGGVARSLKSGIGGYAGIVTGYASRSHYVWGGTSYQGYASRDSDRRGNLLTYSFAYAYRPEAWRRDEGWDWRIFAELTGEEMGRLQRAGVKLPETGGHQIFLGPTTLGVYKNYAVSAGIQFPVHQDVGRAYPKERFRFSINFAYFF